MFIDIRAFHNMRRIPRSRKVLRDFSQAKKGGRTAISLANAVVASGSTSSPVSHQRV
ncbi:MAG: hypothetical protein IPK98_15485 [Chloracidobacterium sp.]|nr:hypothetical protein [Chloracidobacterium sp.]